MTKINKILFLGTFLLFVSFVSFFVKKEETIEGIKNKKKKKKNKNSNKKIETASKTSSTPTASKIIQGVRKFPLYNYIPLSMRIMIENFISFIIFI